MNTKDKFSIIRTGLNCWVVIVDKYLGGVVEVSKHKSLKDAENFLKEIRNND